jgi:hypothetical protein
MAPFQSIGFATDVTGRVRGPAERTIEHSHTSDRTTTFSSSIGDPFDVISLSTGFEFTEEQTYSLPTAFTVTEGQIGYVGYTPYLNCVEGILSGRDGAADETGRACTPDIGTDGKPIGEYAFVSTSREGNSTENGGV